VRANIRVHYSRSRPAMIYSIGLCASDSRIMVKHMLLECPSTAVVVLTCTGTE